MEVTSAGRARAAEPAEEGRGVNWNRVGQFLGMVAALTIADNLFLYNVGYGGTPAVGVILQAMMVIPAWSALFLQTFIWDDSPIHYRCGRSKVRIFAYFYLAYGALFFAAAGLGGVAGDQAGAQASGLVTQMLTLLGLLFAIGLQFVTPKQDRQELGLTFGNVKWWSLFWLLLAGLYGTMVVLNYAFGLGVWVDAKQAILEAIKATGQTGASPGFDQMSSLQLQLMLGLQSALAAPVMALLIAFGEEYGWRGFLQSQLVRLGRVKGVALLGVIWGLWHAGVIAMGHNYPGYPVAGIFLMVGYAVALGFILSYAVFKSGSIWLAAFLHAANNQILSFLSLMVYRPNDPVFSFGIGLYAMPVLAIVVVLLLLDREAWSDRTPA